MIKKVGSGGRKGIVKVYNDGGQLDSELWSAELAQGDDEEEIAENQTAKVVGIRSIILLIEKE